VVQKHCRIILRFLSLISLALVAGEEPSITRQNRLNFKFLWSSNFVSVRYPVSGFAGNFTTVHRPALMKVGEMYEMLDFLY